MEGSFDVIVSQLRDVEARLRQRHGALTAELQAVEADLSRAQSALSALQGNSSAPGTKRDRPRGVTRQQITALLTEILRDLGALDEERLRSEVESRLKVKRISRVGFSARFREALEDERFRESTHGWRLVARDDFDELKFASP